MVGKNTNTFRKIIMKNGKPNFNSKGTAT